MSVAESKSLYALLAVVSGLPAEAPEMSVQFVVRYCLENSGK